MKHLLIVGARGWGREVYAAFIQTNDYTSGKIDVKGFLDSKADAFDGLQGNFPPIICSPEDYQPEEDDVFFIAMGDPKWRKHYVDLIKEKGGFFLTIICKGACVNPTAKIGEGSFIAGWTSISDNVVLGKHTIIHVFCDLGHDSKVGDYGTLEAYSFLGGYSQIGNSSIMHVRSTLIRHKNIGNNVEVGSSSVVMRNIKDNQHVFGNPAKKINY